MTRRGRRELEEVLRILIRPRLLAPGVGTKALHRASHLNMGNLLKQWTNLDSIDAARP